MPSNTYYRDNHDDHPTVSKRFFVTLPDVIGDALDRWAAAERNKSATLAAFLLEQAVRQAIDDGKVPPEPSQARFLYRSISQLVAKNWDRLIEYGRIPLERLKAMRDENSSPTDLEIARLALSLNVNESDIESLINQSK